MPAEHINEQDVLDEGRKKLNKAIDQANKAEVDSANSVNTSNQAKQIAQTAENKADSVQAQFDQVVIEGDSSVEAAQARVDTDGNPHTTLKARLDAEHTDVTAQLAEKANKIETYNKSEVYNKNEVDRKTWSMLNMGQDIKEAMTGGSVAVVGKDSVNTVNIVNGAVTSAKRTRSGERAAVICINATPNLEVSTNVRKLTFFNATRIYTGRHSYVLPLDITLDLSLNAYHHYIFLNFSTGEFTVLTNASALGTLTENDVYVATLSIIGTVVRSIDIGCDFRVNGSIVSRLDSNTIRTEHLQNESVTSEKRTAIGQSLSIVCGESVPDIFNDGVNRSITFFPSTFFYSGKKMFNLTQITTINLPGTWHNYLFINLNTGDIKVLTSVSSVANLQENEVNIGTVSFAGTAVRSIDIPCDYTYNGESRFILRHENPFPEKSHYVPEEVPQGWYIAPGVEGYEATNHYTDSITLEDIYSVYDNIVSDFPEYAHKTELGLDSSGTYPIYRYEFSPPDVQSALFTKPKPKIVIFTNTHGEEKSSTVSLRNFMQDVSDNWKSNPLLEYVRWNVNLVIIPIVNPYGFVNYSRKNANGVDINRNSSYRWETSGSDDPTAKTYKGTAPFSEKETQYVRDTILTNLDAIACYDYHMNGTSGSDYETMFWHWLENFGGVRGFEEINIMAKNNINKITRESFKRYNVPKNSGYIGYITYNSLNSTIAAYAYSKGIPAATIECTRKFVDEDVVYSSRTMQICTEFIGNTLLNTLRSLA